MTQKQRIKLAARMIHEVRTCADDRINHAIELLYLDSIRNHCGESGVTETLRLAECNWTSTGPGGCDSHCIEGPCGPCLTE